MDARHLAAALLAALLIVASAAVALPSQAADQASEHADDRADDPADARQDDAAGPADQARYGLCTAFGASETGQDHGQAGDAGPFQWLVDLADGAVDTFCGDVDRPAEAAPAPV